MSQREVSDEMQAAEATAPAKQQSTPAPATEPTAQNPVPPIQPTIASPLVPTAGCSGFRQSILPTSATNALGDPTLQEAVDQGVKDEVKRLWNWVSTTGEYLAPLGNDVPAKFDFCIIPLVVGSKILLFEDVDDTRF